MTRVRGEELVPAERIEHAILFIRGQRVMLDADLARIYQVPTKRLNEQVKRNPRRFSLLPESDKIVRQYLQAASSWATVTPVVLPGYDDPAHYRRRLKKGVGAEEQRQLLARLNARIDSLLRKAIIQVGFPKLLADHAELEWRKAGFWPGVDLADRYGAPAYLRRFPRYHVTIAWRDSHDMPVYLRGPVCVGGGRFCGLGLFAPLPG